jgi:hypothetical protein
VEVFQNQAVAHGQLILVHGYQRLKILGFQCFFHKQGIPDGSGLLIRVAIAHLHSRARGIQQGAAAGIQLPYPGEGVEIRCRDLVLRGQEYGIYGQMMDVPHMKGMEAELL